MDFLDMRTIVFSYVITDIICVWFVVLLWRQNRNRFAGTAFWAIDFVLQVAALFLIVMRGAIPDWTSMVLSNTLVIVGAILGFMGLERFVGKRGPQIHNYLLVTLFIFVHSYFALVQPSLVARNLNLSMVLLLVCFQCVWLLWHRAEPGLRSLTFGVGVVFFLYCLASVVRIVQFFIRPHAESNYLQSGLFEALMLVSYQVLFILLTYSLVLMVNKRLLMEIATQEEKFAKAFHSAPYAITLTRPSDGMIIDINETFVSMTGYERTEVMGKKTIDLHLWEYDQDRAAVVDALTRTGGVHGMEMPFRKKNGEAITGLFSAEIITIDGEKSILSSIGDITARKQAETALQESHTQLERNLKGAIDVISETIERKGPYTPGYHRHVSALTSAIAREMGLTDFQARGIELSAAVYDIGLMTVPIEFLQDIERLDGIKLTLYQGYPQAGHDALKKIEFPWPLAETILQHRECYDGSGFPQGIRGEETLIEARILAVAAALEDLTTHRSYRNAFSLDQALEEISSHSGSKYDPEVVAACLRLFKEKGYKMKE